jgi:FAD/FMN-containing dehydrogenase
MSNAALTTDLAPDSPQAIRARLASRRFAWPIVLPGEEGWDEARRAWNLAVDQQPALVAMPETAGHVAEIVRFAREQGLHVAPQGTGHAATPLGSLDDTILLKTERMRRVEIDPGARVARAEAGVLWGDVTEAASEHGLVALAGSSPDVGVVGYTLGGGIGWLARRHGLAASSVVAVEVVAADGRLLRADAENEPDLFWALRGGGGSFGIVTAIEFALYPAEDLYAGWLFFPLERAADVFHAWREWTANAPDEVTSISRLLRLPPLPELPEPLRGRSFAVVEAAYLGSEEEGVELLRPLRELGPEMDTFAVIPASGLQELHMDPPRPVPGIGDGMLLGELTVETVDALVDAAGPDSGSPLLSVEVRHLGGALAESKPGRGALASIDADYALYAVGVPVSPEVAVAVESAIGRVKEALAPWDAGRDYLNFTERRAAGERLFSGLGYRRLRAIKAAYDPQNVIRANHPVQPAS